MNKATLTQLLMKRMSNVHVCLYRRSGGQIGKQFLGGDVLMLTVTGRKSGQPRTLPLMYVRDGDNFVIIASNAGLDSHPTWWLNLQANPIAEVQIGSQRWRVKAEQASPEEKARLWLQMAHMYPGFDIYQRNTQRDIPLVKLQPIE